MNEVSAISAMVAPLRSPFYVLRPDGRIPEKPIPQIPNPTSSLTVLWPKDSGILGFCANL